MLRVIMLSLVWAICSTCLVRPWFWKGVINKTLVINYEEKRIGFTKSWKSEIVAEIFAFIRRCPYICRRNKDSLTH